MECLGFEPGASEMVGADETTELWRTLKNYYYVDNTFVKM